MPPALVLGWLWSANAGYLLMCTTVGMYLNYELFHWCCHVKDDRVVRWVPFVNSLRRHHIAHHNQAIMMERNFNLTYPIADWLFRTSDLKRGSSATCSTGTTPATSAPICAGCATPPTSADLARERAPDELRSIDKLGAPPARLKRSQASLFGGIACGIGVFFLPLYLLLAGGPSPLNIAVGSRHRRRARRSGCGWPIYSGPRIPLLAIAIVLGLLGISAHRRGGLDLGQVGRGVNDRGMRESLREIAE